MVVSVLLGTACGDDLTPRRLEGAADSAPIFTTDASDDDPDATRADGASATPAVVFDDAGAVVSWNCGGCSIDDECVPGAFLDLTMPADMQTGAGTAASIRCYGFPELDNETPGGVLFLGWSNPDAAHPSIARGQPFVLEGVASDYYDIEVTPPLAKYPGDRVGSEDDWGTGNPPTPRVQVKHVQDYAESTAPTQIWFTSGIIGVRFPADDGVHYGFVELEYMPGGWTPLRWGYQPEPDQPLPIPR